MMPILVKSDYVKRGRKAKVRHGRFSAGGTGVNGLNQTSFSCIVHLLAIKIEHPLVCRTSFTCVGHLLVLSDTFS